MSELATFQFRAKRIEDATKWGNGTYNEGHTAYRIPVLTSSHLTTPRTQQGTRHTLLFGGGATRDKDMHERRIRSLLKNNGMDQYNVYADEPTNAVIVPDKSGFMAVITLTIDLSANA